MRLPPDWEFLIGDLQETRNARRRAGAGFSADVWYVRQIARALVTDTLSRLRPQHTEDRALMRNLMQDVRFAGRLFAAHPMFAAIAVFSLGIAIGANALVYGVVDALAFNPFPFHQSDRLVSIGDNDGGFDALLLKVMKEQNWS